MVALITLAIGALLGGPHYVASKRADRTADRLVRALHEHDTGTFSVLSTRGSAHNWLCIQRLWPAAFWTRAGHEPVLERLRSSRERFHYRTVGDPLPGESLRATLEFFIPRDDPEKVLRIFVDSRTGVWTPEVRACLLP
jgi:hypothetical protein